LVTLCCRCCCFCCTTTCTIHNASEQPCAFQLTVKVQAYHFWLPTLLLMLLLVLLVVLDLLHKLLASRGRRLVQLCWMLMAMPYTLLLHKLLGLLLLLELLL
jgi:hypothetical protein